MIKLPRRTKKSDALAAALGVMQVPVTPGIRSVIEKLGQRWRCPPEATAYRILILGLTGWSVKYAEVIHGLSQFVPGRDDVFRRTCQMLCQHFDTAEIELGEAVKECDRVAWLETMLDTLKDRRADGKQALLSEMLAETSL